MYYYIKNFVSFDTYEVAEPWVNHPEYPDLRSKPEHAAWRSSSATEHRFYSGVEGIQASARIGVANEPLYLHALIADYDAAITDMDIVKMQENDKFLYMPAYYCTSFQHGRLVFPLSERVALPPGTKAQRATMAEIAKQLGLRKMLPGFDDAAFSSLGNYYDVREWEPVCKTAVVPADAVGVWMFNATKNLRFGTPSDIKIPLDKVAEEVERRWPGRWKGDFADGCGGVRFWDPAATHPRGCVIRPNGVQQYSGDGHFLPWAKILGGEFVHRFEQDKLGAIINNTFVDRLGRFWMQQEQGMWTDYSKDDFHTLMRVRGFETVKPKGAAFSEMDLLDSKLLAERRVDAAAPMAGYHAGLVIPDPMSGERYLNTKEASPMQPAAPFTAEKMDWDEHGPEHFPLIHKLITSLYCPEGDLFGRKQLRVFLAWVAEAYQGFLAFNPQPSLVLISASEGGAGKTLLNHRVLGPLFGGYADAKNYLLGDDKWTDRLSDKPLWLGDDITPPKDAAGLRRYTSILKSMAATATFIYEKKYGDAKQFKFRGRVKIDLNVDDESLRSLPLTENSVRDKFIMCHCGSCDFGSLAGHRKEIESQIAADLPNFARFMADFEIPDSARGPRFAVTSFMHPIMGEHAFTMGDTSTLLEALVPWLEAQKETNATYKNARCWVGTSGQLYQAMCVSDPSLEKEFRRKAFSMALSTLMRNGLNITKHKDLKLGVNMWSICFDLGLAKSQEEGV